MHAYIHTHTYMHAYMHAFMHARTHTYTHIYNTHIHTYIHTYIHTHIHTHTYIVTFYVPFMVENSGLLQADLTGIGLIWRLSLWIADRLTSNKHIMNLSQSWIWLHITTLSKLRLLLHNPYISCAPQDDSPRLPAVPLVPLVHTQTDSHYRFIMSLPCLLKLHSPTSCLGKIPNRLWLSDLTTISMLCDINSPALSAAKSWYYGTCHMLSEHI